MPQLITEFKNQYPNVTFRLYQGANETLRKMMKTGDADIRLSPPPLPNELLQWTVEKEPLYAVLPKTHPLAAEKGIKMKGNAA
ncbi:LysR substrate-binding domain-containing protein [Bacillus nakamurai]|nr:LysR substrate-binding domain-containing protein [Bacillus nakamurai]MED1226788.1 LysR substrate-binding domain-containing protein [Bacillus nakamurai]